VDASLRSLPTILPVLDFSTIKNELFPVIASVFTKTSSLGIKVRGLEAFVILCGGSNDPAGSNDGLDGIMTNAKKTSSSTALDKYTMQEKIVPLIRAIKTKEPAVAMAALNVLHQVGTVADADFVAMDLLPVLWSMSLGPLLDLKQFQAFIDLIKSLSSRVEAEQTKKLQELSGTNGSRKENDDFMSFGATNAFSTNGGSNDPEIDFERLVKGTAGSGDSNPLDGGWDSMPANATAQRNAPNQTKPASFAWSTPSPTTPSMPGNSMGVLRPQGPTARTITPDLSSFGALSPTATQYSQPLQPQIQQSFNAPLQPQSNYNATPLQQQSMSSFQSPPASTSMNWGTPASNPWSSNSSTPAANPSLSSMGNLGNSMSNLSMKPAMNTPNAFSLPLPPGQRPTMSSPNSFSLPPPPGANAFTPPSYQAPQQSGMASAFGNPAQAKPPTQKSGLDAYQSLL